MDSNKINLAAPLSYDSIVDGPGLRFVIWTQGCNHHCKHCHNPHTHDYNGGKEYDIQDIIQTIHSVKLQDGLTLSGGEPFDQAIKLLPIVQACIEKKLNVWAYSGYTFEEIKNDPDKFELLKHIDVLVDGLFDNDLKDYRLLFKGSSNQKIIDVQESLKNNHIVLSKYENQTV